MKLLLLCGRTRQHVYVSVSFKVHSREISEKKVIKMTQTKHAQTHTAVIL